MTPLHGVTWRLLLWGAAAAGIVVGVGAANACEPTVIIGRAIGRGFCAEPPGDGGTPPDPSTPVPLPWTTGFEAGFCDYVPPLGFCLATGTGSFSIVTSPVHSGQYAAAFSVRGAGDGGQGQARCVQQGVFPSAAYYGAWYYLPAPSMNNHLWNLFHFQGGNAGGPPNQGLWDLSLVNLSDGGDLHPILFDFLHSTLDAGAAPPIPISQWFHLEVYFKRAKDATGEITVWLDGVIAAKLTGLVTDSTDWGQWYVGNLADALLPPTSTVYVDDITIASGP